MAGNPAPTGNQTIGPFWHLLEEKEWADLTRFGPEGERIVLTGTLYDADGPMPDGCIEIWQSDPPADDRFPGFGRSGTDRYGQFRFTTLKPGPVRGRGNTEQAPHLAIWVHARGLLHPLATRAYFHGDPLNATDPVLSSIEDGARRDTLIARPDGLGVWRLDLRLQGDGETVFMAV
jgi:protocatechuate 3,4-dioxygenase alpha subunit